MLQLMKGKGSGWVLLCLWLPLASWARRDAAVSPSVCRSACTLLYKNRTNQMNCLKSTKKKKSTKPTTSDNQI